MSLILRIVSPEKIAFVGEVDNVVIPGASGEFEILPNHAPLISSLEPGKVRYSLADGSRSEIEILGGFAEVQNNNVSLCVELK